MHVIFHVASENVPPTRSAAAARAGPLHTPDTSPLLERHEEARVQDVLLRFPSAVPVGKDSTGCLIGLSRVALHVRKRACCQ